MSALATAPVPPRLGLVLTRREGQRLVVVTPAGERLVITVARIQGDNVRLAILAPTSHAIHRDEALDRAGNSGAPPGDAVPLCALGPDSTDLLKQHKPTGS